MNFTDWLTADFLATFAGATTAVILMVQVIKRIAEAIVKDKWLDNYNRIAAAVMSLLVMFGVVAAGNVWTVATVIIAILNAGALFLSATAGFDYAKKRVPEL